MKKLFSVASAVLLSLSLFAQSDEFHVPRTLIVSAQNITAASGIVTNGPLDCTVFAGMAKLDIFVYTNTVITVTNVPLPITLATNPANYCYTNITFTLITNLTVGTNYITALSGGTLSAALYSSDDNTNLSLVSNLSVISSSTAAAYTNYFYGGTNLIATNNFLLPGTPTTPTAASSGFATPYLAPLSSTTTGAITLSPGWTEIGFNIRHGHRYLYVVYTPGGTVTNFTVASVLTTPIQ